MRPGHQRRDPAPPQPHPLRPERSLADGTAAFDGDRIATRRNDPTLLTGTGAEVRNRHTWTVTTVHRGGDLTVTEQDRGTVRLPAGYVARHVELGWATTGYGNQGVTVDAGIAVIERSATRTGIYVAMTVAGSATSPGSPDELNPPKHSPKPSPDHSTSHRMPPETTSTAKRAWYRPPQTR